MNGGFNIIIKTLTGKKITIEIDSSDTINTLKTKIAEKEGIPSNFISINIENREFYDNRTLADYGITSGCTIPIRFKLPPS
jgi:hypothetical protein